MKIKALWLKLWAASSKVQNNDSQALLFPWADMSSKPLSIMKNTCCRYHNINLVVTFSKANKTYVEQDQPDETP